MGEQHRDVMHPFGVGHMGLDAAVGQGPDRAFPAEKVAAIRMVLLAVLLLAAEGGPWWRAEAQVLGGGRVEVAGGGGVVGLGGGEQPEVVVDGAAVGDPGAAADVGAAVGGEQLVEVAAQLVAAAAGGCFGGDGGEPQVVAGVDPRPPRLVGGEADQDGGGSVKVAAFGEDQGAPGRPGFDRRRGAGAAPAVSGAFAGEAGQFPALDVADPDGVGVAEVVGEPL
jgi:hypothetical protein